MDNAFPAIDEIMKYAAGVWPKDWPEDDWHLLGYSKGGPGYDDFAWDMNATTDEVGIKHLVVYPFDIDTSETDTQKGIRIF